MFILTLFCLNIFTLIKYKNEKDVDTKEVYPAIERRRPGAEAYTFFRGLGLLILAVSIPLLHHLCVIIIALIFFVIQIYYIHTRELFKYRVLKVSRIIHTVLFLLYNLMYLIYYLI